MRDQSIDEFLGALAAEQPGPSGGAVAALCTAAAAGLVAMSARFSAGLDDLAERMDVLRARAVDLAEADIRAYARVLDARRDPGRGATLREAVTEATDVPLAVIETALEVARGAARAVAEGNRNLGGDAVTGSLVAAAAARSGAHLVRLNATLGNLGDDPVRRAERWRDAAEQAARDAEAALRGAP